MKLSCSNSKIKFIVQYNSSISNYFPSLKQLGRLKNSTTKLQTVQKLNGLYSLLEREVKIKDYLEPMAGIGFSSSLVRQMFYPKMFLNDINIHCCYFLKKSFSSYQRKRIDNEDCFDKNYLVRIKPAECCFLDNNYNVFRKNRKLLDIYQVKASRLLLCTECIPFPWNLPFSIKFFSDYLKQIRKYMKKYEWYLNEYFLYPDKRIVIVKFEKIKKEVKECLLKDPFTIEKVAE